MGCGPSSLTLEQSMADGVVDLTLVPGLTDADAASSRPAIAAAAPVALRMPRWGRPGAALSGDGLAQLCLAGAGSLRSVELNEAAVPRVTPEAAAQALGLLGDVREVSLRGESLPRRVLAVLGSAGAMPMTTVRSVLLGGRGVDAVALAALPRAFPCVERLYLQDLRTDVDWAALLDDLAHRGVVLPSVERVVVDGASLPAAARTAVQGLCFGTVVVAGTPPHPSALRGVADLELAAVASVPEVAVPETHPPLLPSFDGANKPGAPKPRLVCTSTTPLRLMHPVVTDGFSVVTSNPGSGGTEPAAVALLHE